jgi:hypothetical protein
MRKTFSLGCLVLLCSLLPTSAFAWGYEGHRLIMARAIDLLPPELKTFFEANRAEIVVRVVDPDVWRIAGWDDNQNHFIDFGMPELGPYPFTALPRDYNAALEKFGMQTLRAIGLVPWREAEEFGNLRRAFEGTRRQALFATTDIILFSAVASHYIQDATQPLHATSNFDGQLTGQAGLHTRYETTLIERYASRLTLSPAAPTSIPNIRDWMFETLLASYRQVDQLLAADKAAIGMKDTYDDEYFEKFFTAVKPMVEQELSLAATATASMVISAWEQAGKPPIPLKDPRPIQKVRK